MKSLQAGKEPSAHKEPSVSEPIRSSDLVQMGAELDSQSDSNRAVFALPQQQDLSTELDPPAEAPDSL